MASQMDQTVGCNGNHDCTETLADAIENCGDLPDTNFCPEDGESHAVERLIIHARDILTSTSRVTL